MERKHIKYFDYLRSLGVFLVVYLHVASPIISGDIYVNSIVRSILIVLSTFGYTAVPLFFMMSGYLILTDSKTEKVTVLLKHRIVHLIVPLIFWSCLVTLWVMWKNDDILLCSFIKYMLSVFSTPIMQHLWYVYTLIAIYLLSPILYVAINNLNGQGKKYLFVLIIFIFLQSMVSAIVPDDIKDIIAVGPLVELRFLKGHLCTFILGYFLGNMKRHISNLILISVGFIDLLLISSSTIFITLEDSYTGKIQDQSAGFAVLLAACIFLFFKQNLDSVESKVNIVPFVQMSFGIYLMHNLLNRIFSYIGWEVEGIISVGVKMGGIILICCIILKTLATCKITCFLATGVSFLKANETFNWRYTIHKFLKKR